MNLSRFVMVGLIISTLIYVHVGQSEVSFVQSLEDIRALAAADDLNVESWSIQARKEQGTIESEEDFNKHVHNISEQLLGWDFKRMDSVDAGWRVVATKSIPQTGKTESIQVMAYPQQGKHQISHTYELNGSSEEEWNSSGLLEHLNIRLQQFNLDNAKVITQFTAKTETEELLQTARDYLQLLNAEEVEGLVEETFVSLSAYNDNWHERINTNEQQMNVQVALRQDQGLGLGTTVTIGTPIITTEY